MAKQKLQKQVTNLPGFSEYRIDEELQKQLQRQAQNQMARDLMTQAQQRQERLHKERVEDFEYSKKIKRDVQALDQKEQRYDKSVKSKNARNREELTKQLKGTFVDQQNAWGLEKELDQVQM
mmetsp:Transcript_37134/g.48831  ORF Transcript_37134/g.48831 Transcript_37134/m.48831 type:complete len:122 (+) Transcript_37134:785-1150(+)|eukprot:CAMPEP_0185618346 /NCGR_PEP_ID=MMETSP0436-20130131/46683_1 /TAXON_ID=626734 ORGANISM="Favella taraikaensis, Strain Fe Narragansett Bay" /NCGR_SAMPLE_ID=MMETSP0436 /ASSEMBLY_ACC=CAM_ASM_000390 /LENGTH=121 /DNA_ID=CAMNT_0028256851 /DNA_START=212 /DNA_END=577 /DNA_ORIENTATION=-